MLLDLLKRDLKLHWDALVVPLLILVLVMGAIGLANEGAAMLGLVACSLLFIPILPIAIHIREATTGTLGDLLVLPVSRASVVNLRYLEVLLFTLGLLVLAHLGTWVALSAAAHKWVPFGFMDRSAVFGMSMLLLFLFAYPMPFALRWGGRGIGIAYSALVGLFMGLGFASELSPAFGRLYAGTFLRCFTYLMGGFDPTHDQGHPGQAALLLMGLFTLSYLLSRKAFAGKDL